MFATYDFMLLDHTFHSKFHDRIAEWLENSYLKRFPKTGKFVLSLYVSNGKDDKLLFSFLLLTYHLWLLLSHEIFSFDFIF